MGTASDLQNDKIWNICFTTNVLNINRVNTTNFGT